MDTAVKVFFQYLLYYYEEEQNEEDVKLFEYDTILILNKVEDNYWILIVIFPLVKQIEIIDSRRNSKSMEEDIHLLWKFLWCYCDLKQEIITAQGWKFFCSRETIQKNNM